MLGGRRSRVSGGRSGCGAGVGSECPRGRNSSAGRATACLQTAFAKQTPLKFGEEVVWDGGFVPHLLILPLLGDSFATPPENPRN